MHKIAIFVEGYSEAIFTKQLILSLYQADKLEIKVSKLISFCDDPLVHNYKGAFPEIEFNIFVADGDNGVVSYILKKGDYLLDSMYESIICLRDLYSQQYEELLRKRGLPLNVVNPDVNQEIIDAIHGQVSKIKKSSLVSFHFSIMEIEAWFLSFYKSFVSINRTLSEANISAELGLDISTHDLEAIFKPGSILKSLRHLSYSKKIGDIHKLVSLFTLSHFAESRARIKNLDRFIVDIEAVDPSLLYPN